MPLDPPVTPHFTNTMRPLVAGWKYAVSSMKPQATDAARQILEAGGNAFDAAVAGQAVLALTDPSQNGYGGDASTLVYDAKAKSVISINGAAPAPRLATIEWYERHRDGRMPVDDSLLAATVPSVVDTWFTLLDRWGTKSFSDVLQPAIEIAEDGFALPAGLAATINASEKLRKYATSASLYQPPGVTWREGDVFRNPDAGRLLRKLVEAETAAAPGGRRAGLLAARDRFYKGDIARAMAAFSEAQGALFRYDDFATYSVEIEAPVSIAYRGYDIYKNPSATQGPAELFALNILEGFGLAGLGHNSAAYIHTSAEAVKLAMADRERFLGDARFLPIPFEGLLSKAYGALRREQIDPGRASLELRPGDPFMVMETRPSFDYPWSVTYEGDVDRRGDTSYLAVVDTERNMVSFEPSLHSTFGCGVVMEGLGIIFNCRGDYFALERGKPYTLEPGKRPRSTLQSTLVLKHGRPFLVAGSPGGDDQIMRTLQTLLNIVDFGMNVQAAIEAPRWSSRAFPASPSPFTMIPGELTVESRIPPDIQVALAARGHRLSVAPPWSIGSNAAILIDHATGMLHAGADPRVDAYAWAR